MKRTPWGRIERPRRGARVGAALLGVVLVFVLLRLLAPNLFLAITTPVLALGNGVSSRTHMFFSNFANARTLTAKLEKLEEEHTALAILNRTLTEQVRDLGGGVENGGLVAGVVSRPPVAAYDTLVLAAGSEAGVMRGMAAYASGVPIGIVSLVTASFARVTLFSAPGMETPAWVGSEHLPAMLHGAGAGAVNVTVPRASKVVVGDSVFLAGPGAKLMGQVKRVGGDASDPVATLFIRPLINPFSVTWVTLLEVGAGVFVATTTPSTTP